MKKYLKGMDLLEIENLILQKDYPKFRAKQIYGWLYQNMVIDYDKMINIPKDLKLILKNNFIIETLKVEKIQENQDTKKFLFKTHANHLIETVSMIEDNRHTICLSSQVGCAVDCDFCATGKMGFKKNLNVGEIIDQLIIIKKYVLKPITNIVFMGMGEPFLNYTNVIKAANLMNDKNGMNIGYNRITISTSGILPKIESYIKNKIKFNLAISLNATTDIDRNKLMPINKKWPIRKLIATSKQYNKIHKSGLTFEYVLIKSVNDSMDDAMRLAKLFLNTGCKINIIPLNEIGGEYQRPDEKQIEKFINKLNELRKGFTLLVRWSKGTDIDAGCGQLATNK